jgi:large subunit ribosomal protein L15
MTVNKRKKVSRYRGSCTHGGGSMKKRRGSGHRGGRGLAGGGKRADQNKPTFLKLYGNDYFGKHGFVKKNQRVIKPTTLSFLNKKLDHFVEKNLVKKVGTTYVVNLQDLGFNKVLGTGNITKKLKLSADYVSKKAIEKIEAAGGKVEVLESSEEFEEVPEGEQ